MYKIGLAIRQEFNENNGSNCSDRSKNAPTIWPVRVFQGICKESRDNTEDYRRNWSIFYAMLLEKREQIAKRVQTCSEIVT